MELVQSKDQCKIDLSGTEQYRQEIPKVVEGLLLSCEGKDCFDHISPEPIPTRESIVDLITKARRILYPGYFINNRVDRVNIGYYFCQ